MDYRIEEVMAALSVSRDEAAKLAYDMKDGKIDLGLCIHRKEEEKRRFLLNDGDPSED